MTRNKHLTALVSCALLIAIEIILTRFLSISTPIVRIGFGFAPIALAGILFGPWYGCAVGALADLLGANLFPTGPFWPGFTLVAGLTGFTYGLMLYQKAGAQWSRTATVLRIAAAVLIVTLLLQLGLDTVNLVLLLDKGFFVLLPGRITKAVVMIPVQFVTINALYRFVAVPSFRLAR